MSIEAMKQALEALENSHAYLPVKTGVERGVDQAITALSQAIAEAEKQKFECPRCGHCCREWVGLTDEERSKIWGELPQTSNEERDACIFAQAIEAKLKEKNR